MKALVIRQPWAWAIMEGHKRFENRTWQRSYRGPVAVIAAASTASLVRGTAFIERLGLLVPDDLPRGCILGVVTLTDIIDPSECDDDPFAEGPFCWQLSFPVKLERPVPFRGQLGLFDLPTEVLKTGSR